MNFATQTRHAHWRGRRLTYEKSVSCYGSSRSSHYHLTANSLSLAAPALINTFNLMLLRTDALTIQAR